MFANIRAGSRNYIYASCEFENPIEKAYIIFRQGNREEAMLLEDALVNDISKYCDPKYNLKAYIHAKTFGATYKIPNATKEE